MGPLQRCRTPRYWQTDHRNFQTARWLQQQPNDVGPVPAEQRPVPRLFLAPMISRVALHKQRLPRKPQTQLQSIHMYIQLIPELLNIAHGCSQHGPATAWLVLEWPAVIPVPKHLPCWEYYSPANYETVLKRRENVCSCLSCGTKFK